LTQPLMVKQFTYRNWKRLYQSWQYRKCHVCITQMRSAAYFPILIGEHRNKSIHYWQDLDLSGFKNLKGLAKLHALNEKLLFDYAPF
ncbi:MAG: hypothetical protein LUP91_02195, partial [Methylococcaceae bacterium]|nr:hypothetical protein [Methylococcaceae bacterium]